MSAECPLKLFKLFRENIGGWVRPEKAGQQFLYDALGDHMDFSGVTAITIPPLDDAAFKSWEQFGYWCEEIKLELMWKIVDYKSTDFELAYEKSTPKKYIKSKSIVRTKIIQVLSNSTSDDVENVMYVEIHYKSKKLFLIYFDSDSWALGHGSSVLVVKSLAYFNKKNGFYPIA